MKNPSTTYPYWENMLFGTALRRTAMDAKALRCAAAIATEMANTPDHLRSGPPASWPAIAAFHGRTYQNPFSPGSRGQMFAD